TLVDCGTELRHTGVVKSAQQPEPIGDAGDTRAAVVQLLLEEGPITAGEIGRRLGLTSAGVRRHLDVLIEAGQARATRPPSWQQQGRGRPAKRYQLTSAGRAGLRHAYDDLAGAAVRRLRTLGGDQAVRDFARDRVDAIVADIEPVAVRTPATLREKA